MNHRPFLDFPSFLQLVCKAKQLAQCPAVDPFPADAFSALSRSSSIGNKVPLDLIRQMLSDYNFNVDVDVCSDISFFYFNFFGSFSHISEHTLRRSGVFPEMNLSSFFRWQLNPFQI